MASSQQHDIQIRRGSSSSSKRRTSFYEQKQGTSALIGSENVKNVSRERIGAERELLVSERQSELARVLDRHDDLVREVFHLEKFVTMVSFDPKTAKEDNSAVFQQYKANYDLLEKATTTTTTTTARKTRSAHTERLHTLGGGIMSSPPAPQKTKLKAQSNDAIWDIIASAKGRAGKGKSNGIEEEDGASSASPRKGRHVDDADVEEYAATRYGKRGLTEGDHLTLPRKRRKTDPYESGRGDGSSDVTTTSRAANRFSARLATLSTNDLRPPDTPSGSAKTISSPPTFKIKRIKLLVRRPPPILSSPRQRPPPPRYGSSLPNFLSSYKTISDQDLSEEAMDDMARHEASLLDRIDHCRQQGWLLFSAHDVPSHLLSAVGGTGKHGTPQPDLKREPSVWDHVLHTIMAQGRVRRMHGKHVAGQIANKVQGYWDGYAARKDKAKVVEEKRLRALAKSTVKMIIAEWKKAVFHIREQERLKMEAEEKRLGHQHLDAILDQSGQILETQHGDLRRGGDVSRSRSRSSSVSVALVGADSSEEEEPSEEEEEEEEEGEEGGIDQDGSELGDSDDKHPDVTTSASSRVNTPELQDSERASSPTEFKSLSEHVDSDDEDEDENDDRPVDDPPAGWSSPYSRASSSQAGLEEIYGPPPRLPALFQSSDALMSEEVPRSSSPTDLGTDDLFDSIQDVIVTNDGDVDQGLPPSEDARQEEEEEEEEEDDFARHHIPSDMVVSAMLDISHEEERVEDGAEDSTMAPPQSTMSHAEDAHLESAEIEAPSDPRPASVDKEEDSIPDYLKPYAVAPMDWNPESKIMAPLLLRGVLRPYQQSGLEWLASLHTNHLNGILADEMGLGKTIQSIALLAHLACDRGIWGPHLIIVPTSVLLNWEMEFKKFLPGFKILSYHGSTKRRKELRQGWNDKQHFNVCITSYTLASRDAHIFKRKAWYYMILDEAHMIKNFKSQRWNILLMFRSFRRLLLTGTPLQNNLTELWALLQFLMSGSNFANLKEFGEWFSNPLEKAIEMGTVLDDETMQRASKLHTVLRPYLLRRLKRDVEKELPRKYDHLVLCPLSKRQRFLYDEFLSRSQTRDDLQSGVYQKVANILMQLRKVCNHPDLFEVRQIVTSFAMERSAIADFEIKELLIRRRWLDTSEETLNLGVLGLRFADRQNTSLIAALESRRLDATSRLPFSYDRLMDPPQKDTRTIEGFKRFTAYRRQAETMTRWSHIRYLNRLRCNCMPIYSREVVVLVQSLHDPLTPSSVSRSPIQHLDRVNITSSLVKSCEARAADMAGAVDKFAFVTPAVVARDVARIALAGSEVDVLDTVQDRAFDAVLHRASVKLQIAFPDPSLLQYDCGKLQELTRLLREKKAGGHRILIFTQMTRILDILEIFLNFHGYLYLRLDGATKIEDRQYITERFNADSRVFCFIASSRSGGVGINLTGADTVVFYDSDFNPQMDRQCEDRAHRIGQIRDVHIYRFISQHTVEEAMLRKANQKRSLDDLVIQKGEFDWRTLFSDEAALTKALGEVEDREDAHAAEVAAQEAVVMEGADEADFGGDGDAEGPSVQPVDEGKVVVPVEPEDDRDVREQDGHDGNDGGEDEGGTTVEYMLSFVSRDYEFFKDWRL